MDTEDKIRERLELEGASYHTIKAYTHAVRRFLHWVKKPVSDITTDDVIAYLTAVKRTGISARSLAHHRQALLRVLRICKANVDTDELPKIKYQAARVPNVISREEVDKLINAVPKLKHKAALWLGYECALRPQELANLRREDLDLHNKTLLVRALKGGEHMLVPIMDDALIDLLANHYLKGAKLKPDDPLFPIGKGKHKHPYTADAIGTRAFRRVAKKVMPHKRISYYCLRHSRATHLLRAGADFFAVNQFLRHRRLDTTKWYLHLVYDDLKAMLAKAKLPTLPELSEHPSQE